VIELKGFPILNQLHSAVAPSDGKADENAVYNCVPTSLAMCLQYLTGKRIAPDDIKDAVYGQGHVGGGSELAYAPLMRSKYGLKLTMEALPSASQQIIDRIRFYLSRNVPVIVTMHSKWSTPWFQDIGDGLHVGVAKAISETDAGELQIANPWRGFSHNEPVAWWRDRLGNGVWPVAKIAGGGAMVPQDWTDKGGVLTAPNGVAVIHGFRDYVLNWADGWETDNWPLNAEYGTASIEPGNPSIGAGVRQDFRYRSLGWTETRDAYRIWLGVDYTALVADYVALTAQVADLRKQLAATSQPAIPEKYVKALAAIEALRAAQAA